ncbi:MAG: MCE family protein [Oligoflexia bacterium]|nr:MCE family protein [Oligoflexia bacterium]
MNEFKVGLMALATMASIVAMSLLVTKNQSGFGEYVPYRTIIKDASGIFPKTPIKVAGINAGRIKNIELADNNALITFEVLEKVGIPKDSQLKIKSVGFLGDKYLEIVIGKSTEKLDAKGFISANEGAGLEGLIKDAGTVMKDVKVVIASLKDSLAPEGEEAPIKTILNDVKESTASLKRLLTGNEQKLNELIANMKKFSGDIAYQVDEDEKGSSMEKIKSILGNADKMMNDLQKLVADVKAGKGTVGKLLVEEEIADEVQQTLAGVKKLVGRVDQIRTELELFTGANTRFGAETELSLKIFPSPERFYLLGLTTSEFGPESTKLTTTTVNGVSSTEVREEKQKDSYRFNVQLGRKIQNWTIRGGLIESSGGFGLDYSLSDWGSKFSFEVFDYRDDIGPNLRVGTELQIWNVIYGKVALEDILEETTRSATISAGLKFTDEDLKGLIGFFL